jgi:uncharacterized protein
VRVVLDSNVLIAAAATRGLCEAIVELCLERHQIVLGNGILEEVQEKLIKKIKVPRSVALEYLELLRTGAELVEPLKLPRSVCRDPNDLMVLGLVAPGAADIVVSGDKDLLVLGKFSGARILSPRDFWETLQRS